MASIDNALTRGDNSALKVIEVSSDIKQDNNKTIKIKIVGPNINKVDNKATEPPKSTTEIIINKDGALVFIIRGWLPKKEADELCEKYRKDVPFDLRTEQLRKTYACGDDTKYSYAGSTLNLWLSEAKEHRDRIEKEFKFPANSCLLNQYKDGTEGIGWHSDKEVLESYNNAVYTVSLGGSRHFQLREKYPKVKPTKRGEDIITVMLNSGDLVGMLGKTQDLYAHCIPKRANAEYRISESFRLLR